MPNSLYTTFLFQEQLRNNQLIVDLLKTEEGVLALCIVQEFLEFCNLKFTRTILETEIGVPSSQINSKSRQQLMSDLKLKQENNTLPVLCQLLEANSQHLSNKDQISKTVRKTQVIPLFEVTLEILHPSHNPHNTNPC
jgi:FOP N terminal dimerisation domain.